jgi:hypothetical protein
MIDIRTCMLSFLFCISISFLFLSCKRKKEERDTSCVHPYTLGFLLEDYDSSGFKILRHANSTVVTDTLSPTGLRGYYKFDKNGNLQCYSFLTDTSNYYNFSITYDSLGREINRTGDSPDLVGWLIGKRGKDSLEISVLFYKINYSYWHVILTGSDFSTWLPLFEMKQSNIIGGSFVINKHQKNTILLSGIIEDNCSNKQHRFTDSLSPSELY